MFTLMKKGMLFIFVILLFSTLVFASNHAGGGTGGAGGGGDTLPDCETVCYWHNLTDNFLYFTGSDVSVYAQLYSFVNLSANCLKNSTGYLIPDDTLITIEVYEYDPISDDFVVNFSTAVSSYFNITHELASPIYEGI